MTDLEIVEIVEIGGLIHSRWSKAFDALKRVHDEKNDGSVDWSEFHEIRLHNAIEDEAKWLSIKESWIEEHRDAIMRTYN